MGTLTGSVRARAGTIERPAAKAKALRAEVEPRRESERPFPPGAYPVVVVGSGPGALQFSYSLRRAGVEHAVISADDAPGGMFRRFPIFQRLISWTKPYAPAERGTRPYQWYDWNSLLADRREDQVLVAEFMDGTSEFPSRPEMERALVAFAERARIRVRYGCRWERTRRTDDGFVLVTSDGEYRCRVAVFAVGMTEPWKPPIAGLELVPHYVEMRPAREYAGRRVFVIGKRNSGFEIADGLLPWARTIVLGSPRAARPSVLTRSLSGPRARYLQPYEDALIGGGTYMLDVAIERVERAAGGYRIFTKSSADGRDMTFEMDEVIAATGFATPLGDLPEMGVATFFQGGRLPAQTPFWESPTVPGIFFAGSVTQGSIGLKKHGLTSNSAAVHGFRYNARVMAAYIARTRFGVEPARPTLRPDEVVPYLLSEVARGPELWNQQSYLARVVSFDGRIRDEGILPLAHFVDSAGPDAVAVALENDGQGEVRPALYVRRSGRVDDAVLDTNPLYDFETPHHRAEAALLLKGLIE